MTPAGEYFYKKSLVLINDFDRLCMETVQLAKGVEQTLTIGYLKNYQGNELQRQGEFGDERFGFANSIERKRLTDADKAAFACYPKGAPEPEAGELLRSGTPADATAAKPYTVEDLDPNTTYIIAAAASSGEAISEVARIEMTTLGNVASGITVEDLLADAQRMIA